jgi:hypothetical protein
VSDAVSGRAAAAPVAEYKRLLRAVLENRPSGTRQRLASALGTNRSFVSQMTSPAYPMPIPAIHLDTIFSICHFSQAEREGFRAAYARAHPGRLEPPGAAQRSRTVVVRLPDLGNARSNRVVEQILAEFARQIGRLAEELR